MKKLILICSVAALVPLAGCVYRPYPYHGYYYGDRDYGGSYGYGRYDRDYRDRYGDRYRDSDGRDYRNRYGYYDRDDDR